jgi:hypothetical protein
MDPKKPAKPNKPAPTSKPAASKPANKPTKPTQSASQAEETSKPAKPAPVSKTGGKPQTTPAAPAKTGGKPQMTPAASGAKTGSKPTKPATAGTRPATPARPTQSVMKGAVRPLSTAKAELFQSKRNEVKLKQQQWNARRANAARPAVAVAALDQETQTKLQSLQTDFDDLQDDIMLSSVYDDMGRVEGTLLGLASDLEALRMQKYVFGSFLENKISVLTTKWESIYDEMDSDVNRFSDDLAKEADETERYLRQALGGNRAMVGRAEGSVRSLSSKASSARTALTNRYSDVSQTIQQTREQLDQIKWAFEQANEACFDFLQGEDLVAACKAKLLEKADGDEGMQGVLYLTDARLIFERKEKVATKKILFVTTASEMVQECQLTVLVGWVEKVEAEDTRKFLSSRELLRLQFAGEAPVESAILQLLDGAKNEAWVQLINRVRVGEMDRERVAGAAEETSTESQVSQAPTICPTCGAALATDVVRGQTSITCDYCNTVIRL